MRYDGRDLVGAWELYYIKEMDDAKIGYLYDADSEVVNTLLYIARKHGCTGIELVQNDVKFTVDADENGLEGTSGVVLEEGTGSSEGL